MRILVTGAKGFIGKNLVHHLIECEGYEVIEFNRENNVEELRKLVAQVDLVIHLAGINRPQTNDEFIEGNVDLTEKLCHALSNENRKIPIAFASSVQVTQNNEYGNSKLKAENILERYGDQTHSPVSIFRLPNVFGKWCKPNYNSVVATFCHNIANDLPISIHDPSTELNLIYIDDLVEHFLDFIKSCQSGGDNSQNKQITEIKPQYRISLQSLANKIYGYHEDRGKQYVDTVAAGLDRALYATYLSYLKPEKFNTSLILHQDTRGVFAEVLKTKNSGQISVFSARPEQTRGGHYHHTKNEKFLVVAGKARFRFYNIDSQAQFTIETDAENLEVVETVPGWAHDITNIGDTDIVVLLWSNEVFDENHPDTYASAL